MEHKKISTEELKQKLDKGDDFLLVNVLSGSSFEAMHIPGSINIDMHDKSFLEKFSDAVEGNKNKEIVSYCSSIRCQTPPASARKLAEAGYTNVLHYEEGVVGWKDAGNPMEGSMFE